MRSLRRLGLGLLALALLTAPAFAADVKPVVVSPTSGQQQRIQSTDTLQLPTATTANASINIPHGAAPTSPANGDMWTTTSGVYIRINGSTIGPLSAGGGSPGGSAGQIQYNNAGSFGGFTVSGDGTLVASTGVLTVTKLNSVSPGYFFSGTDAANLTGTVACARFPALTGDVTTSAGACATTIGSNKVTLGNIAQSAANTMLGNWTGSTANVAANAMPSCGDTGGNHLNYVSGTGITCGTSGGGATFANPTATAGPTAINGSASTAMRSDGAPAIQLGSAAQKGIVQVDGTTITASGGVISTVGGGSIVYGFNPFIQPGSSLATPTTSGFTLTQNTGLAGAASQTNTTRGVLLNVPATVTGDNLALLEVTPPGSTPWTCTLFAMMTGPWLNFPAWGVYIKDNAGKIVTFGPRYSATGGSTFPSQSLVWYAKWTNINTFSAQTLYSADWGGTPGIPTWIKVVNNGTTFTASISHDGENYNTFSTPSVTDFLGATISKAGVFYDNNPGVTGLTGQLHVFSWLCA